EGLVKRSLADCTVAHITNVHIVGAIIFFGKSDARTQWNLSPYDTVASHKLVLLAEKVHRASLSFRASSHFAKHLSHRFVGAHPFCDSVGVIAVSRNHGVLGAQYGHCPGNYGLLANI